MVVVFGINVRDKAGLVSARIEIRCPGFCLVKTFQTFSTFFHLLITSTSIREITS